MTKTNNRDTSVRGFTLFYLFFVIPR